MIFFVGNVLPLRTLLTTIRLSPVLLAHAAWPPARFTSERSKRTTSSAFKMCIRNRPKLKVIKVLSLVSVLRRKAARNRIGQAAHRRWYDEYMSMFADGSLTDSLLYRQKSTWGRLEACGQQAQTLGAECVFLAHLRHDGSPIDVRGWGRPDLARRRVEAGFDRTRTPAVRAPPTARLSLQWRAIRGKNSQVVSRQKE